MNNYIYDGEIHALDETWAYIIEKIPANMCLPRDIEAYKERSIKKICEYILKNHPQRVLDFMLSYFISRRIDYNEDIQIIFRPTLEADILGQHATLAIKFKRSPNDGLNA